MSHYLPQYLGMNNLVQKRFSRNSQQLFTELEVNNPPLSPTQVNNCFSIQTTQVEKSADKIGSSVTEAERQAILLFLRLLIFAHR